MLHGGAEQRREALPADWSAAEQDSSELSLRPEQGESERRGAGVKNDKTLTQREVVELITLASCDTET